MQIRPSTKPDKGAAARKRRAIARSCPNRRKKRDAVAATLGWANGWHLRPGDRAKNYFTADAATIGVLL